MLEKDYLSLNEQLLAMLTKAPSFSQIYSLNGKSYSGNNVLRLWVALNYLTPKQDNELSVWGTYKAWQGEASPVKQGETSVAKVVWSKKEQATDEDGNLVYTHWGHPIWNWRSFSYPSFHCSQVKGFRESEFIERKNAYQKEQVERFEKKQAEAKVQKSDFIDWASTQATPKHLWSILQQYSVIDDCPIHYFNYGLYGKALGVYSPDHTIGLCRQLKSFKKSGVEGSKNWDSDTITDLEVLTHEMVHSVSRETKLIRSSYFTEEGQAIEELVAYFGTVLFFQMFGITKSGFLSGLWNSRAEHYVDVLKSIFDDNVEEGYVIIKDANLRVNHILKTVFEKRYGLNEPEEEIKSEIRDAEDALA